MDGLDPDAKFERLLDSIRSHDAERRQELAHMRLQNQMMQAELAKRNSQIQNLQAQVQKLTEFKRSILRSVKDPSYGVDEDGVYDPSHGQPQHSQYAGESRAQGSGGAFAEQGSSYPNGGGFAQRSGERSEPPAGEDDKEFVDGRDFFVHAQRELSKEQYKEFLGVISDYNRANVASLPFEQANAVKTRALTDVRRIFGPQHEALFQQFCVLMSRG
eukprot:TRINITY_DN67581_c0_g1_i1.p1 TRINITY_DN67581_c0_g1~~TRINITY_DN67581_c0_g1_i1.p1  ORF type:complete len:216 (-),score=40.37 TRINITY_DN67581_c0_g1_i1:222-869(-)